MRALAILICLSLAGCASLEYRGDCKDRAAVAVAVLQRNGHEATVAHWWPMANNPGHVQARVGKDWCRVVDMDVVCDPAFRDIEREPEDEMAGTIWLLKWGAMR